MTRPHLVASLTLASCLAAALLAACGGGADPGASTGASTSNAPPTASAASYRLQTYITDDLTTDYAKVWVSIESITALNSAGTSVTLFDAGSSPVAVNLASLANVGQFLSSLSLPAELYTEIRVTLSNSVQLVSTDGLTTINAKFSSTGSSFVWRIRDLALNPATTGQLVLDFDLKKFSYNASTGLVTPAILARNPKDAFGQWVHQQAHVHGTVTAVNVAGGSFTVSDSRLGGTVVVTLSSDAVITSEATHSVLTLATLAVGSRVEVKGSVTPGATTADPSTVTSSVVHVLPEPSSNADGTAPRLSGEGTVLALDGQRVTVSLQDANFLPGGNSVVLDLSHAQFAHGQLSDLAVGVAVHFAGTAAGTGSNAVVAVKVIDLDGAPSDRARHQRPDQAFNAGVSGAVTALRSLTDFTLNVTRASPTVPVGSYTVDATQAHYRRGNGSCLAVGAQVRVRGTVSGSVLTAMELEVEGCAGQKSSGPG
jgi:hypothetical protein